MLYADVAYSVLVIFLLVSLSNWADLLIEIFSVIMVTFNNHFGDIN